MRDLLRRIPSVDSLVQSVSGTAPGVHRPRLVAAARRATAEVRERLLRDEGPDPSTLDWAKLIHEHLERLGDIPPVRVINATGVPIHTNLGRVPLAQPALDAVMRVASGYCALEYDLDAGVRGSRHHLVKDLLLDTTGAEDALVVNNNAAAVLLACSTLAKGGDVVVSRGELVEIGGSFRIPEVIEQSGARLREVGTTNRTHPEDYRRAIGPGTRLLLKVHQSNYTIRGFVAQVEVRELVSIARPAGLPVMVDLGSGCLVDLRRHGLPHEPTVREALDAGADLVTFSGDKLVGGPQAGIVVGAGRHIAAMRRHPLMRALRPDKMTLAALAATLGLYRDGIAMEEVPALRMLATPPGDLERKARSLVTHLERSVPDGGWSFEVAPDQAPMGGGSLPGIMAPTWVVTIQGPLSSQELHRRLRSGRPPVIGRLVRDRLALDVRTIQEHALDTVALVVAGAINPPPTNARLP